MNPNAITRVLIVDDHPLMRESLRHLFEAEADFAVVGVADSADTALQAVCAEPPDLVLVDITLRDSSGLSLLDALQERAPAVRAMVISMHDEPSIVETAFRRGARAYVSKSCDPDDLVATARRVVGGELVAGPDLLQRISHPSTERTLSELVDTLSERERDVFVRLGRGRTTREIADEMGLSIKTIQTFCARIKDKLHLDNASTLVSESSRWLAGKHGSSCPW